MVLSRKRLIWLQSDISRTEAGDRFESDSACASCGWQISFALMAKERPLWLEAIVRLERAVGEQVESFVRSDTYFDLVTQANRARARMTETVEGWSKEWLHLFNLPANTDIRAMQEQLARMERRLVSLAKEVADLEEDGKRPSPRRRASAKKQSLPPTE
jgi:hypothetical protein